MGGVEGNCVRMLPRMGVIGWLDVAQPGATGIAVSLPPAPPVPKPLLFRSAFTQEDAELGSDVGVSGEGERHHVILPSYPNYEEMDLAAFSSRLEARLGKPMAEISEADLTPAIAKEVLGLESKEEVEARVRGEGCVWEDLAWRGRHGEVPGWV